MITYITGSTETGIKQLITLAVLLCKLTDVIVKLVLSVCLNMHFFRK